ncbi:hypothetical protein EH220_00765 [bacterium]|nr:MAG: hypothetical protein EH220_00765 [bacterium]
MRYGFGELDFYIGDIWELATQALISPVTEDLHPVVGIGSNLVRRAGPEIAKELADHDPIGLGHAFVTKAGTLRAKWLIHTSICTLASPPSGPDVCEALDEALSVCQHMAIKSVAVPAMAIEPGELPVRVAANVIVRSCFRSFKMSRLPERIVLVVPSPYVEREFKYVIEDILDKEYQ